MPGWFERWFGGGRRGQGRDYRRGPQLGGLDSLTRRSIELQKAYWSPAPEELAQLEDSSTWPLSWPAKLRRHHLLCLELLEGGDEAARGALRRALLAPRDQLPDQAERAAGLDPGLRARVELSARELIGRRSPVRPRHGVVWLGEGPPAGDDIPYSDLQGRILDASLAQLGSLEVLRLDERLEPSSLEMIDVDQILTLAIGRGAGSGADALFRPARILREYGREELLVLLPMRHGLTWFGFEPELLRGPAEREVASCELAGLADPAKAAGNPDDRRALGIRAGPHRLEVLSDDPEEGLSSFTLTECYQLSLAIDQEDPAFEAKCEGRGLDPDETRRDAVRELASRSAGEARAGLAGAGRLLDPARLRASARELSQDEDES